MSGASEITITTRHSDDGKSSIEIFPFTQEDYMEECPICYEEILPSLNDVSAIAVLSGCGHRFCRLCISQHCEYSVTDRNIPIPCPHYGSLVPCNEVISDVQVHAFLCSDQDTNHNGKSCQLSSTWNKYQRFQQIRRDPFLAACPKCNSLVSSALGIHILKCTCGHAFCSLHGDAHQGMSCEEFQKARQTSSREEILSSAAVKKFTKPCSHCNVPIEKEAGCDHIICPQCKNDFCFKCGTHMHLSGEGTIRNCSKCNQRYIDHRKLGRHRFYMCLQLPIIIPYSIIYTACMLAIFVASCFFGFCFGCGLTFPIDNEEGSNDEGGRRKLLNFMPAKAARATLGCLLLPWAELLESFGLPFCETILDEFYEEILRDTRRQEDDESDNTSEIDISVI